LKILTDGADGEIYNLGGSEAVSHAQAADWVASRTAPSPQLVYKSQPGAAGRQQDFFPDLEFVQTRLGLRQAIQTEAAISRAMAWHASRLGVNRRLRPMAPAQ
jgi:UDP-glucose 4-epimerase